VIWIHLVKTLGDDRAMSDRDEMFVGIHARERNRALELAAYHDACRAFGIEVVIDL
jgi:hypothetical protein